MHAVIFATDRAGANVYSSSEWTSFTGQPASSSHGDGWAFMVHPDDLGVIRSVIERAMNEAMPFTTCHRLMGPAGVYVWVVCSGSPSFHPINHRFTGFVGSITQASDQSIATSTGCVGVFNPPPPHPATIVSQPTDLAIDYLLLARSLVAANPAVVKAIDLGLYMLGNAISAKR